MSLVHCTHVLVAVSQISVVPVQKLVLVAVQLTQVFVVVLHAGVLPEQLLSSKQPTQLPLPSQTTPPSEHVEPDVLVAVPHVPLLQTAVWQLPTAAAGQSASRSQPTQLPAPSQTMLGPLPHGVSAATNIVLGVPLVHVWVVHAVLGATFASSAAKPHVPLVHVACWHEPAEAAGQSAAVAHPTQFPAPSQTFPVPHEVCAAANVLVGTPATHVAAAQTVLAGAFASSAAKPHVPLVHVAC